jgi:hypothetical protein
MKKAMRWEVHLALVGKLKNAWSILFRKLEGKETFERPRGRQEEQH